MSQPCPPLYPDRWLDLYRNQDYDRLSEAFLEILDHFREHTYFRRDDASQYFINAFVKHFLYFFSQGDYTLSDRHIHRFIQHNLTVSNVVALSSFKTTDAHLALLLQQSQNFVKVLTLYSARNRQVIDPSIFFNADAHLACLWYCHFLDSYRSALVNPTAYSHLRRHLAYSDPRLVDFYNLSEIYLGATYINDAGGEGGDRVFKAKINRSIQNFLQPLQVQIQNQPNPRKVAIITAKWFKTHVVYRTIAPLIKTLAKHYDLTLVHLGPVLEPLELSLFQDVRYVGFEGNTLNLQPLLHNDFGVIYYPDIGMNTESILLSNLRLAPIQLSGVGHPISTGGSQIDYFVSGAAVELPTAQQYYAETLHLMPGLGAVHHQPDYVPLARRNAAAQGGQPQAGTAPVVALGASGSTTLGGGGAVGEEDGLDLPPPPPPPPPQFRKAKSQAPAATPTPAHAAPKSAPTAEPKPDLETDPKSEPKPAPQAELNTKPNTEPKSEPKPAPQAESQPELTPAPKSDPKSDPKSGPHPAPKAKAKTAPQAQVQPSRKSQSPSLSQASPTSDSLPTPPIVAALDPTLPIDRPDRLILNCPWMSPKVNAPLIQVLRQILDQTGRSVLLRFFSSGLLRHNNDFLPFEQELHQALGADRVVLMPYAHQSDYLAQLDEGHLSLDSFPFGGSNVVADSLYLAQPIVVLEGDRWYNRVGPQLLRRVGLEELIAHNPQQYQEKALKLIEDDRYRAQIRHHLQRLDPATTIFNPEGSAAFKPLLEHLIRQHYASPTPASGDSES